MATNIDKALYAAPAGLDQLAEGPDLEIEIEDPESVTIGIDGMEIEIEPGKDSDEDFDANLAEYMDDRELVQIVGDLVGDYEDDVASRKDWIQTYVDGLQLLGMKIEDRMEPWPGACISSHPKRSIG